MFTQNYNRYSYCLNNPLKYTDPSGYSYKPDDWDKANSVSNPWFNAGRTGNIGPGSSNHWSDSYRTEYGNYMLSSTSTFNNLYGSGASQIAKNLANNPALLSQWQLGMISIDQVRRNSGNPNLGSSEGLAGVPGKSVVENQYCRWEYNTQGVWVQTAGYTQGSRVAQGGGGDGTRDNFLENSFLYETFQQLLQ